MFALNYFIHRFNYWCALITTHRGRIIMDTEMEEGELSSASSAGDEEGEMVKTEVGEKTEPQKAGPEDAVLEESLLGALQEHIQSTRT